MKFVGHIKQSITWTNRLLGNLIDIAVTIFSLISPYFFNCRVGSNSLQNSNSFKPRKFCIFLAKMKNKGKTLVVNFFQIWFCKCAPEWNKWIEAPSAVYIAMEITVSLKFSWQLVNISNHKMITSAQFRATNWWLSVLIYLCCHMNIKYLYIHGHQNINCHCKSIQI